MRVVRVLPTLLRIGFAKAAAYRAEVVIWILASITPLIMLPLWHAVAEEAPVRGFAQTRFTAYFLAAFVVRQIVGAWAAWTINWEVRSGALNALLLRPIHPIWSYVSENVARLPLRSAIALPFGIGALLLTGGEHSAEGWTWLLVPPALLGAWAISFLAHVAIGALSFWIHQSIKVMDLWNAGFFVLSGYLVPIALFPAWARGFPAWLPWEYQLGFPVELLTGSVAGTEALRMLGAQWAWVAILAGAAWLAWRRGLRHYGAFGG